MGKKEKNSRLTAAKRNIITSLIQEMMDEMTEHFGYDEYERSESTNFRNGRK